MTKTISSSTTLAFMLMIGKQQLLLTTQSPFRDLIPIRNINGRCKASQVIAMTVSPDGVILPLLPQHPPLWRLLPTNGMPFPLPCTIWGMIILAYPMLPASPMAATTSSVTTKARAHGRIRNTVRAQPQASPHSKVVAATSTVALPMPPSLSRANPILARSPIASPPRALTTT